MFKKLVLIFILIISFCIIIYPNFFIEKKDITIENIEKKEIVTGTITYFIITTEKRIIKIKDNKNIVWVIDINDNTLFKTKIDFKNGLIIKAKGNKDPNEYLIIADEISEIK